MEVPVVARHIPDNVAIIDNGITGLLFRSPDVSSKLSVVF